MGADFLDGWDDRGAPWDYWVERSESARSAFARLVNGAADDVAVTTSASAGLSAFASAVDFEERPRVVIAVGDRAAVPVGHPADSRDLRGDRRDRADGGDRDRGDPRACQRLERPPDRRPPGRRLRHVRARREPARLAHSYNTEEDIDAVLASLASHRALLS